MKKKWICSGIVWIGFVCIIIAFFLDFAGLDYSGLIDAFPENLKTAFEWLSGYFGSSDQRIDFSAFSIVKNMVADSLKAEKGSTQSVILRFVQTVVISSFLSSMLCLVFSFIHKTWGTIAGLCSAIAGLVFNLAAAYIVIPKAAIDNIQNISEKIADQVEDLLGITGISDTVSSTAQKMIPASFFRKHIFNSMGRGWWIWLIAMMAIMAAFLMKLMLGRESGNVLGKYSDEEETVPAVVCLFGELDGIPINLSEGEKLTIGSDPAQCNIVLKYDGIDALHLSVALDKKGNGYCVEDYSRRGIRYEKIPLSKTKPNLLPGGTILTISDSDLKIFLV